MLILGLLMEWTIGFDDQSLYGTIKWLHISTGVLLAVLVLPRIAWRLYFGWVRPLARARLVRWLSVAVPMLMLLGVLVQAVTGVMARWTARAWPTEQAQTLPFFGLAEIPGPFAMEQPELNRFFEAVHGWTAYAVMALLLLHMLGALGHWLFDRTAGRWRMLKPGAPGQSGGAAVRRRDPRRPFSRPR